MKTRKTSITLAVVLLTALLAVPLLAGGTAGAAVADNGGRITLPVQTYTGYVVAVTNSDLPRFELLAVSGGNPVPLAVSRIKPTARYVLLVPTGFVAPLKTAATPDARGFCVPVRIQGAPVAIPSVTRTSPAIVVQKVEILWPKPLK
ncbi:MAG: hypothetical protein ACPLRW_04760 [Moorellales bacterium]